jgi:anaerobic magnesium-protoporphyrin IX monomethyl ester cyclase
MRVLFLSFLIDVTPSYSHAIASLASVLGNHTLGLVTIRSRDLSNYLPEILNFNPDVILMSVTTNQFDSSKELVKQIKIQNGNIKIFGGGSHFNARPYDGIDSNYDAVCYGEGEEILPIALQYLESGKIFTDPSWITRDSIGDISPSVVKDLNSLPLPVLDIFEVNDILTYPSLMFSRGCSFACNYCLSRCGGLGGKVRMKSVDRAFKEVKQIIEIASPNELFFDDDSFLKKPKWLLQFLQSYQREIQLPFYCNSRPESITFDLCKALKTAGCSGIGIGIESGSESIRKIILNRNLTDSQIINAFNVAKEAGLQTWSFNMVGLPTETPQDIKRTIEINRLIKTNNVRVSVYIPYPGTPLEEMYPTSSEIPKSYFDALNRLDSESRIIVEKWISDLRSEGRLWNDD